jgi:hypothetical protein
MDVSKFIQDVQELIDIRDDETLILEFRINKKTKQGKINIYSVFDIHLGQNRNGK